MNLKSLKEIKDFSTPCYVYKKNIFVEQALKLKKALSGVEVKYSLKSNSCNEFVRSANSLDLECDVASLIELEKALAAGFNKNKISFVGPGKTEEELDRCINLEIGTIVVESISELKKIINSAKLFSKKCNVMLRVNPDLNVENTTLTMGGHSQFGIDEATLLECIKILKFEECITFKGFHFFLRSQVFDIDTIIKQFKYSLEFSNTYTGKFDLDLKELNLGGGIPIAYFSNQADLDLAQLSEKMSEVYELNINKLKLTIESGRYISAKAGWFIVKILYLKKNKGKNYIIVDGGFTNNSMLAGSGQVIKRNFPIVCFNNTKERDKYTIAGPSCTPQDILATDIELPKVSEGDYLIFPNFGAYGLEYSPVNFINLKRAGEYFLE